MKYFLLAVLSLLLVGSVASAAEIIFDDGNGQTQVVTWDHGRYPYSITQGVIPPTFDAGGYSCGNTVYNYTTDGWSMRRFIFEDDGIVTPFTVQSVDWGIRRFATLLDSIPCDYTISVKIGQIPIGAPLLFANIQWVDNVDLPLTQADNPVSPAIVVPKTTLMNIPNPVIDPLVYDLIVAVFAPDGQHWEDPCPNTRFAVAAANADGDTHYCYYAFEGCSVPEPITPPELAPTNPEVAKMVIIVNGDVYEAPVTGACCIPGAVCFVTTQDQCQGGIFYPGVTCDPDPCEPIPTEETSWGRVKATYR